eukprot:scaffold133491_cov43-Prasinocladus_malaysianus.AAC.1
MDDLILSALQQALHVSVKDDMLPLPGSKLWNGHIVPNRMKGCQLDIKKSSFKKLSAFLKQQKAAGLITCKEDKHS